MPDTRSLSGLEKKTVRMFAEVERLSALTEQETHVDAHIVQLMVMRFFRRMSPQLRLAIVTQDPGTTDQLMLDWMRGEYAARGVQLELLDGNNFEARLRQVRKLLDEMFAIHLSAKDLAQQVHALKARARK